MSQQQLHYPPKPDSANLINIGLLRSCLLVIKWMSPLNTIFIAMVRINYIDIGSMGACRGFEPNIETNNFFTVCTLRTGLCFRVFSITRDAEAGIFLLQMNLCIDLRLFLSTYDFIGFVNRDKYRVVIELLDASR